MFPIIFKCTRNDESNVISRLASSCVEDLMPIIPSKSIARKIECNEIQRSCELIDEKGTYSDKNAVAAINQFVQIFPVEDAGGRQWQKNNQ